MFQMFHGAQGHCMWVAIDPRRLKVGHFVRIEQGWLTHPFPRSTFTIASQRDIDLILEYGLKRLSIDPGRSTIASEPAVAVAEVAPVAETADGDGSPVAGPGPDTAQPEERTVAKRRMIQEVAGRRQRLQTLSRGFVDEARDCANAARMIDAGEAAGYALMERLADHAVSECASDTASLCFAGTVLASAAVDPMAASAVTAMSMAAELGRKLQLTDELWRAIVLAAALRAIGMRRIPIADRIRPTVGAAVPGPVLRNYPQLSAEILERIGNIPVSVLRLIAQHRECIDGSGFPKGLSGDAIAPGATLVGAIHEYQELTAPGRSPARLSPSEAIRYLYQSRREQIGMGVLNHFVATLSIYPPGTFVLLNDDSVAVVVRVNPEHRLRPMVLMLDNRESLVDGDIEDLSKSTDLSIVRAFPGGDLPPLAAAFAGLTDTAGLKLDATARMAAEA